jgi:hypothetical protein
MGRPKKNVEEVVEQEVVAEGVVRDVKENPMADIEEAPRVAGNWKKVSYDELVALEASGVLLGYDPATGEALVK